jgi:type IV secretory pathway TrbL component
MPRDNNEVEVASLAYEIFMKLAAFVIIMIAFIAVTWAFIYMAINKYEVELILAVGASDGLVGYCMVIVTKKLFR